MDQCYIKEPSLICVDWGSSNFRAYLMCSDGALLDQVSSNNGMLNTAKDQFESVLISHISKWRGFKKLPILLCGMVGSNKGWQEVDYVECPTSFNDLAGGVRKVKSDKLSNVSIVPGIKCLSFFQQADVMRGEEVQILGALSQLNQSAIENTLFCLPGTHSKWARVGRIADQLNILDFQTYMTGEIYALLDQYSILGYKGRKEEVTDDCNYEAFYQGLVTGKGAGGLMHHLFSARTNVLTGRLKEQDVHEYLSGLLIATEINEMVSAFPEIQGVYLISNSKLSARYQFALDKFNIQAQCISGEKSVYMGMYNIAKQQELVFSSQVNSG